MNRCKIAVLGATGSIGRQAIDVIERNPTRFDVVLLTAHTNQCALGDAAARVHARQTLLTWPSQDALLSLLDDLELDMALIGASGTEILPAVFQLAKRGINLALANKECIVAAGKLLFAEAERSGCKILPVDSEHSAIFQCLQGHNKDEATNIIFTASGGALRDYPADRLNQVTVGEVLKHPNWEMGKKITVDSATMMNKGLELIEGRFLFDMPADKLSVVIHPQSIVHSMVSFKDGTVLAQMGKPDMRVPIAYALGYPERMETGVAPLPFNEMMNLSFYPPEPDKFRCLDIAREVLRQDKQSAMISMNAANEVAVLAFLAGRLPFMGISAIIEEVLGHLTFNEPNSVDDVIAISKVAAAKADVLSSRGLTTGSR